MENKKKKDLALKIFVALFLAVMIATDLIGIEFTGDERRNEWISRIVQQTCGFFAVALLMRYLHIRLFGKPQGWVYLIPCFVVAIDNFPFWSYFKGNMQFERIATPDFVLFALYCLAIGLFEESVFRGLLFSLLAGSFSKDKKGLIKTFFASSFLFGAAHLFNLFVGAGVGATLLQVCYTTLTGGLFAFALIKTQNIFIPALVHAVYNFCGLIFSSQGLGTGVVFDLGTGIVMTLVSVCIGAFVLYSLFKYPESERVDLYKKLLVNPVEENKTENEETESL